MTAKNVMIGGSLILAIVLIGSLIVTATINSYENSADLTLATAISKEQASSIALSAIKGTVKEAELEKENGRLLYSVEINNDKGEHDVKVDAYTGELVKIELESDVGKKELLLIKAKITEEQAKAIALGKVKGTVSDIEVKKINGKYLYEVEVKSGNKQSDVLIDLISGKIIAVEEDFEELQSSENEENEDDEEDEEDEDDDEDDDDEDEDD